VRRKVSGPRWRHRICVRQDVVYVPVVRRERWGVGEEGEK